MRKYLFSLVFAACGLCLSGCQSSPGFSVGFQVMLPPTLRQTNALSPLPTAMGTTYAVDTGADLPLMQRQIQVVPAPAPRRLQPAPQPQQLPMPRQTIPGCQSPAADCTPGTTQE